MSHFYKRKELFHAKKSGTFAKNSEQADAAIYGKRISE